MAAARRIGLSAALAGIAIAALAPGPRGIAGESSCIQLRSSIEVRVVEPGERGKDVMRLEPVDKVSEGDEVIYTVAAANVCKHAVPEPTITYAMPKHMTYVPGSAIGPAADVTFSIDGGFHFATPEALMVEVDGMQRPAKPEQYTHLRWIMRGPLASQAIAFTRFRAIVK